MIILKNTLAIRCCFLLHLFFYLPFSYYFLELKITIELPKKPKRIKGDKTCGHR